MIRKYLDENGLKKVLELEQARVNNLLNNLPIVDTYSKSEIDSMFENGGGNNSSGTDTKNTAGATNSASKLFLVGAPNQTTSSITYTNSGAYAENGKLYSNGTLVSVEGHTHPDTKNTAGATDSSSKLFIVGSTEQSENPQTYTQDTAYIGTDGCLYSNNKKVLIDDKVLNDTAGHYNIIDGIQIRWGHYTGSMTNYQFTITFDIPFPNGCLYADIMNGEANTTNTKGLVSVLNKSATSVTFGCPQGAYQPYWIAFGY